MIVGSRSGQAGGGGFDSRARYDPDTMLGQKEREMSVYRFTFEMVLDVEGETREDALATAYGVLQEESPELVDWQELDAPVRCDECGEPCDGNDAVTDGNIALCGSFYGNGCADRAVWRGDLIVGIDGKEW